MVLLALEQSPSRLIPASHDTSKLDLINAVSSSPVASTSTLPPSALDITAPGGVQAVERKVLEVIGRRKRGDKVLLVLDSVDALAEHGVQAVFSLVHKALKALERLPGPSLPSPPRAPTNPRRLPSPRTPPPRLPLPPFHPPLRLSPPHSPLPDYIPLNDPPHPPPLPAPRTPLTRIRPLNPSDPSRHSRPPSHLLSHLVRFQVLGRPFSPPNEFRDGGRKGSARSGRRERGSLRGGMECERSCRAGEEGGNEEVFGEGGRGA